MRKPVVVAVVLALAGCVPPVSPSQLLADTAYDMNIATRFGRMDVAIEHVGADAREDFTRDHARWGRELRVVDIELNSMNMSAKDEADVSLSVVWQRLDEAQVRTTHIAQRWQDGRGGWRMTSEERSGGDFGLIGDQPKAAASAVAEGASRASGRASFQTRVIRATD